MRILPPITQPWRIEIVRSHDPLSSRAAGGFRRYRPCLRWEFGFSCAFCLCHEADLVCVGAEGSGVTQVEHFVPQSHDQSLRGVYENCFYICRSCNLARTNLPNTDEGGRTLLDPCSRSWRELFFIRRDRIQLRDQEDSDAAYTMESYQLNEPRKVRLRKMRRVTIQQCIRFRERTEALERALLDQVEAGGEAELVEMAWAITVARRRAYMDLYRFGPVPLDYDSSCRCEQNSNCKLPSVLEEQLIDVR